MADRNSNFGMLSEAAATSIEVTPVNLSEKQSIDYLSKYHFDKSLGHLNRKGSSRTKTLRYGFDIPEFIHNLNLQHKRISALAELVSWCVYNGAMLQDLYDSDGVEAVAQQQEMMADIITSKLTVKAVSEMKETNDYRSSLKTIMSNISSGSMVIKDSEKFEGGKDIYFNNTALCSGIQAEASARRYIPATRGASYEHSRLADYTTPISESLLATFEKFREEALAGTVDTAHQRSFRTLGFDYNYEKWRNRFATAGLYINEELMSRMLQNLPMSKARIQDAKEIMSIAITHNPSSDVTNSGSPWNNYLRDPENTPKPNNAEAYSREGLVLQNTFAFSVCLHVPAEYVDYITQTEDKDNQLFRLSSWAKSWSKYYIRPKGGKGAVSAPPKYVISPSMLPKFSAEREKIGLPVNKTLGDEYGLTINREGNFAYIPDKDDFDSTQSEQFEKVNEDYARACFEANQPVGFSVNAAAKITAGDPSLDEKMTGYKHSLNAFRGTLLGYDLDFGILVYAGQSHGVTRTVELGGTTKPQDISIADYLGYDFAGEGESPNFKSFRKSMLRLVVRSTPNHQPEEFVQKGSEPVQYVVGIIKPILDTYLYMMVTSGDSKYKSLQEIINTCMEELNITDLRTDKLNRDIYLGLGIGGSAMMLNEKGNLPPAFNNAVFSDVVLNLLQRALNNAKCEGNSPLFDMLTEEFGSAGSANTEKVNDPRYFNEEHSKLGDFSNLYHHLGGRIIYHICNTIANTEGKKLLSPRFDAELDALGISFPSFEKMSRTVLPTSILFSKYVPRIDEIFEKAEDYIETLQPEEGFEPEDLKLPGLAEGTAAFPHQLSALSTLQHKPKFAILDISPGGGKTILGVLDILNLIGQGEDIRPLVICPDHLVTNWCDDIFKVTKGTWNVIPLSAKASNSFDDDELDEVLAKAPINTITICGIDWIKNHHRQTTIAVGERSVSLPERVDILRKHQFNYVCMDESHKAKNFDPHGTKGISARHTAVKLVTTAPYVKYVRLATGTLTPDRVRDVVGQANLFTASIFGTVEAMEFDLNVNEEVNGRMQERDDAPLLIRSKLSDYVAMISKKRKDWAFMLPNPIDNFVPCRFGFKNEDMTVDSIENQTREQIGDRLHFEVYEAVLNSLEDDLLKDSQNRRGEEDDGAESDDDAEETGGYAANADSSLEVDENGDVIEGAISELSMALHTPRLEQLLTDPWSDPIFKEAAKSKGLTKRNYVPIKLRVLRNRLDTHFTVSKYDESRVGQAVGVVGWEKGMRHRELDLVNYKGQTYMARILEGENNAETAASLRREYPTPSEISPDMDTDRWKVERTGKVLIFCRYVRTANAVYDSLPTKYKNVARVFHGSLQKQTGEDKWANLELFRNQKSDDCQILVAVEQAITEGQNLQIASRIIRVEAPWSPGDYEQATARIFRPDVAAATVTEDGKAGDMAREVIFIDWLMCDGTLEVPKVARLAAKTVETTAFSEKGNPRYDILRDLRDDDGKPLKPPSMSIEFLKEVNTMEQLMPFFEAKALLNDIEKKEFWEMRKTTVSKMIPIPSADVHPDFKNIVVKPVAPNVHLNDGTYKWQRYIDVARANTEAIRDDVAGFFNGAPVHTPYGKGVIVGMVRKNIVDPNWADSEEFQKQKLILDRQWEREAKAAELNGEPIPPKPKYPEAPKIPDPENPVSTFKVRLADNYRGDGRYKAGELISSIPSNVVHFAGEITSEEFDADFRVRDTWSNSTEKAKVEREREKEAAKERERLSEEAKRAKKERERLAREERKQKAIEARIRNESAGRPINEGVTMSGGKKPVAQNTDMRVAMEATVYNGFVSLVAQLKDPDAADFDKMFDFVEFNKFIYIDLFTYPDFEAVAEWLETRQGKKGGSFILDEATTLTNLGLIADVFDVDKKDKFNIKLATQPQSQLPFFLRTRLQKPRGKNAESKVRIYPIVMSDRVRLCIDTATSPQVAAKFLKYAPIPNYRGKGAIKQKGKWQVNEFGHTVFFCNNPTEAKRKVKQIVKAGFTITNGKTLMKNLDKIVTVRARGHKLD